MNEFAQILEDAGGPDAPPEQAARLRTALAAELRRGTTALGEARSGYDAPLTVAFLQKQTRCPFLHAVLPITAALRADPGAASERAWLLTAAALGALVEAAGLQERAPCPFLQAGEWEGFLVLVVPGADAELAVLAFEEQVRGIDRLRVIAAHIPDLVEPSNVRPPLNPSFAVAERVARLGGQPADQDAVEQLAEDVARPHEDPDPALRAARRILQRLRGMGKWGGYHTEFSHLAKGFPGHEKQLAVDVGEALLAAGLLAEKPSVGQRHVYLDPRRAADIHALIDRGELPSGVRLP